MDTKITDTEALAYALGALRVVVQMAASWHSAAGLASVAQAGIDLATLGPQECAAMRGDGQGKTDAKETDVK